MHQITEIPAWDSRGQPEVMVTKCTSIKVLEENDRLKISSNYPTGNNISLYISINALNELFNKLPNKFRSSLIEGLGPTKRKLLVAFLIADKRYSCCFLRKGGYTHILKPGHSLYGKYQSTKNCTRVFP
jgi:PHP family Zn ribbon phosphoesterase